eukprot:TRINITY_DN123226_c0_g1_i1.p1 TRINITY_DN123226_c0_g1~~TRINITY_DN123226_c0_g1_i1.p1  ORF type:complete len:285 (+),score=79.35 TRINITY_DN123226_c0_g1_i1:69-923(+)
MQISEWRFPSHPRSPWGHLLTVKVSVSPLLLCVLRYTESSRRIMPVDYSKFDKIEDSGSEGEEEKEEKGDGPISADMAAEAEGASPEAERKLAADAAKAAAAKGAAQEPTAAVSEFVDAARYGDVDDVKALLSSGVDVDAYGGSAGSRATALLMACANGHQDVVQALLDAKADMSKGNESCSSPLHWSALNGHLDICKLLVERKADANARNEFQRRPFDEAFSRGHQEICEFLAPKTDFADDPEFKEPEGEAAKKMAAELEDEQTKDTADDGKKKEPTDEKKDG